MSDDSATWKRGDVTFKWHGGRTINIFMHGKEVDVISFGYNSDDKRPTKDEAYEHVKDYELERAQEAYDNG